MNALFRWTVAQINELGGEEKKTYCTNYIDSKRDGLRTSKTKSKLGSPGLGEVGEEGSIDVLGELGVRAGHAQLVSPDAAEDVLEIVPMGNSHVNLLTLEVDDGVLAPVLKGVLIGGHRVVGQDLGKAVGAAGVHQVGEEVDELGPELILVLHVDVDEVLLAHLPGDGVELAVEAREDREHSGELVVNEVVVIDTIVEAVECKPVEESALILGLADNEGYLGKPSLDQEVLWRVRKDDTINVRGKPSWEGEEHEHVIDLEDDVLLGLAPQALNDVSTLLSGGAFKAVGELNSSFLWVSLEVLITEGIARHSHGTMEKT